jgi:uncharacterized hydantoinase/oxoprolinase family protein
LASTTTDVIPCSTAGRCRWRTDPSGCGRASWSHGARRTPLCALLGADGAAEFFATTLDVYLILASYLKTREH